MKAELEGKRSVTGRERKQRNMFATATPRTKVSDKRRAQIILFRTSRGGGLCCHKKVYDHALESARTSGVAFLWWSRCRCLAAAAQSV
jgi:hypothetical protein